MTKPPLPPLSVTIDAGPAVHQSAGLSRYTNRLIDHLSAFELDLTLFHNRHSGHQLPQKHGHLKQHSIEMGQYQWRFGALLSQLVGRPRLGKQILSPQSRSGSRLYHATEHLLPRMSCPTVLTVHDLIFERFPEHHTLRNRLFLKLAMPTFVRAAGAIIAVSHHTKKDLVALYKTPAEKITVIYEGVDERFQPQSEDEVQRVKETYSPQRPYLLMVGTLEPRKNHATAIKAMHRLRAEGLTGELTGGLAHQLLIVGGQGWLFEPIRETVGRLGLEESVRFAGYVPDEDLPALYSGASAVLMPSLYEGFGFSVVEAMACGTPVIAGKVSSLGEVAGEAALLLDDPTDDAALAALIERVLSEPGLAADLVKRGTKQAAQFKWSETAGQTVELYQEQVAGKRVASGG